MKIAIASDLHLEFGMIELVNEDADLLVLAGDITTVQDTNKHLHFFENCSRQFKQIIYVLGNHEYYGGDWITAYDKICKTLSPYKNIFVTERGSLLVENVLFIVGTMWTDMKKENPMLMLKIGGAMNDYHATRNLTTQTTVNEHKYFVEYLQNYMNHFRMQNRKERVVVITHHAPSFRSVAERFRTPAAMDYNYGFASEMDEMIMNMPEINYWIHGHMHDSFDYRIGNTRVVCNPRGYLGYETNAQKFNLKYVDV